MCFVPLRWQGFSVSPTSSVTLPKYRMINWKSHFVTCRSVTFFTELSCIIVCSSLSSYAQKFKKCVCLDLANMKLNLWIDPSFNVEFSKRKGFIQGDKSTLFYEKMHLYNNDKNINMCGRFYAFSLSLALTCCTIFRVDLFKNKSQYSKEKIAKR